MEEVLMLFPIEQTDELESRGNDILVNLPASHDPSKYFLDIIQNPIIPHCKQTNHIETKVCFSYSYSFLFFETIHTFVLVIKKLNVNS
jgi:hypothetical protein